MRPRDSRPKAAVAGEIFQKSEHGVQIYFVAFDTSADRFSFLEDAGRRDRRAQRSRTAKGA
jgi:hypothetical protein